MPFCGWSTYKRIQISLASHSTLRPAMEGLMYHKTKKKTASGSLTKCQNECISYLILHLPKKSSGFQWLSSQNSPIPLQFETSPKSPKSTSLSFHPLFHPATISSMGIIPIQCIQPQACWHGPTNRVFQGPGSSQQCQATRFNTHHQQKTPGQRIVVHIS